MRLKSYFAATVEAAIGQARAELGDEAMLLDSRPSQAGARHLGAYEVVFALPAGEREKISNPAIDPSPAAAPSAGRLQTEITQLRREMERMKQSAGLSWFLGWAVNSQKEPEFFRAANMLLAADVTPAEVEQLLIECASQPIRDAAGRIRPDRLERALREQMARRVSAAKPIKLSPGELPTQTVAFIGPPGAGKTTALVKLAATLGLAARRPMQIISLDTLRVAATDPLRTYASILGCGFQTADSPHKLRQLLHEHRAKQWIWVDTPGLGRHDMDAFSEWADLFRCNPDFEVHLVLSAAMKSADLVTAVERFECFGPGKVLFTHLDETASYGSLFSAASRCGKPISFLSSGQQVPEDIEPATLDRVLDLVLSPGWAGRETGAPAHAGHAAAGS
jgi:flagellar biosynthesis protein FlhF